MQLAAIVAIIAVFVICICRGRRDYFSNQGKIYLFWRENCRYCQELKRGSWPMFLIRAKNAGVAVEEIEMTPNMSAGNAALAKQLNVSGVPYIVRVTPGRAPEPYVGPRDDESLMSWALRV